MDGLAGLSVESNQMTAECRIIVSIEVLSPSRDIWPSWTPAVQIDSLV
jgi:hypothetical protein